MQTVRFIHDLVKKEGYRVVMLHGQRSQPERDEAMRDFRSGKAQVRLACVSMYVCVLALVHVPT